MWKIHSTRDCTTVHRDIHIHLSWVWRGGAGHGHGVHHVLLDVGDGARPRGHAPSHALPETGVRQRRGDLGIQRVMITHHYHYHHHYRRDRPRTDRVLHVQGHQPLPGQDVIIKTIENINLRKIKWYQTFEKNHKYFISKKVFADLTVRLG